MRIREEKIKTKASPIWLLTRIFKSCIFVYESRSLLCRFSPRYGLWLVTLGMSWILLYLRTATPTILWPTAFCCIFPFIFYWKVLMIVLKYWDQHNAVFISFKQCCQSYSALHLESNKYIIVTWKTKQKKKNKMKKDGERYMTAFLFLSWISVSSSGLYLVFWFQFMVIRSTATAINRSHSNRSSYNAKIFKFIPTTSFNFTVASGFQGSQVCQSVDIKGHFLKN